jgi:hypothetical protein
MQSTGTYSNAKFANPTNDGGPAGVARATEANRLQDRMNSTLIGLSGMVGRLQRSVDRISGSVPTGSDDKTAATAPSNHICIMDAGFNDIEASLSRFRNELERLESFA